MVMAPVEESQLPAGALELLIIQPTPFCNLDCDYCYLPGREARTRMAPEILRHVFRRTFESSIVGDAFTVVWHAGEPLVLPISFYEEALQILGEENKYGVHVRHSFQTNATLLTAAWCEFLQKRDLAIGVSVDGPEFLHDRHRKTRSGRGTWQQVVRGIRLLNDHAVPFHVITVLTADSLDYPDELFDFYVEHGVRKLAFNIEEIEGPHVTSSLSGEMAGRRYLRFLDRFFDLVESSGNGISVREFDFAFAAMAHAGKGPCRGAQQTTPFGIVSVDCRGNFSTFSPELLGLADPRFGSFAFGNVMTDPFESALGRPGFQAVAREVAAGVERCRATCEYFPHCGGGAPVNKLFENGGFDTAETLFCRLSIQAPLDLVLRKVTGKCASSKAA